MLSWDLVIFHCSIYSIAISSIIGSVNPKKERIIQCRFSSHQSLLDDFSLNFILSSYKYCLRLCISVFRLLSIRIQAFILSLLLLNQISTQSANTHTHTQRYMLLCYSSYTCSHQFKWENVHDKNYKRVWKEHRRKKNTIENCNAQKRAHMKMDLIRMQGYLPIAYEQMYYLIPILFESRC